MQAFEGRPLALDILRCPTAPLLWLSLANACPELHRKTCPEHVEMAWPESTRAAPSPSAPPRVGLRHLRFRVNRPASIAALESAPHSQFGQLPLRRNPTPRAHARAMWAQLSQLPRP